MEVFAQRGKKWVLIAAAAVVLLVGHSLERGSTGVFKAPHHGMVVAPHQTGAGVRIV